MLIEKLLLPLFLGWGLLWLAIGELQAVETVGSITAHESGRAIYNFRCYYCHGYSGDAKTLATTFLNPVPRDFSTTSLDELSPRQMREVVTHGRPATAMKSFRRLLDDSEIEAVVGFIRQEFMLQRLENTRYHTIANGWGGHDRYAVAFPFATGEIALDTPWERLTLPQQQGKRLFLDSCISCHDRARVDSEGELWRSDAVSYPRPGFAPGDSLLPPDAFSGATPFATHDIPPTAPLTLSDSAKQGRPLFLNNCAFCHAADGSGKNWIGTFMQPHPRDLITDPVMNSMTRARLQQVIRDGLPHTSMPAWGGVLTAAEIRAITVYIDEAIHPLQP